MCPRKHRAGKRKVWSPRQGDTVTISTGQENPQEPSAPRWGAGRGQPDSTLDRKSWGAGRELSSALASPHVGEGVRMRLHSGILGRGGGGEWGCSSPEGGSSLCATATRERWWPRPAGRPPASYRTVTSHRGKGSVLRLPGVSPDAVG